MLVVPSNAVSYVCMVFHSPLKNETESVQLYSDGMDKKRWAKCIPIAHITKYTRKFNKNI
jgi:hypothetical protein